MLGLIFAAPFLVLLVVFALSNRGTVQLGLWPTDLALVTPLSLAVLGAGAVFFVLGALVVGVGSLGQRRRARRGGEPGADAGARGADLAAKPHADPRDLDPHHRPDLEHFPC